jgi:hypothetical protein
VTAGHQNLIVRQLKPVAGGSHVPADSWVRISASRASVPSAWAVWRASPVAMASSRDGLAPSSAHDAHAAIAQAAIAQAATKAAGSAWVARDIVIVICQRRSAWSWGRTQPMGRARIAAPLVALAGVSWSATRRDKSRAMSQDYRLRDRTGGSIGRDPPPGRRARQITSAHSITHGDKKSPPTARTPADLAHRRDRTSRGASSAKLDDLPAGLGFGSGRRRR